MDSIYKLILGILGNAVAVALFASPLPTFRKIFKNRSTANYSGLPYVSALLNCLLWMLYGLPLVTEHGLLIITINVVGSAFEITYLTLFLAYAPKVPKRQVMKVLAVCLASYAVVGVVTLTAVPKKHRKTEVGSICAAVAIAMYVSPLSVMRLVIRTRSVEFMPLLLSVCVFLNSTIWTGYGILAGDIFIMTPNVLGTISGVAQLALHAIYRNAEPCTSVVEPDTKGGAAGSPLKLPTTYQTAPDKIVEGKPCSPVNCNGKLSGTPIASNDSAPPTVENV